MQGALGSIDRNHPALFHDIGRAIMGSTLAAALLLLVLAGAALAAGSPAPAVYLRTRTLRVDASRCALECRVPLAVGSSPAAAPTCDRSCRHRMGGPARAGENAAALPLPTGLGSEGSWRRARPSRWSTTPAASCGARCAAGASSC